MKPMKAEALVVEKLVKQFPVIGNPKLDGIRGIIRDGQVLSNSLKVFPNRFIQNWAGENADVLEGMDGELIVGDPTDPNVFSNTTGPIRAHSSEPDFTFYAFDLWNHPGGYRERYLELGNRLTGLTPTSYQRRICYVQSMECETLEEVYAYEEEQLLLGYEGIMLRGVHSKYKFGRATPTGGQLIKVKRFVDTEAEVIGFQELYSNQNEATKNEMGNTSRSSHKENKVPMNTLGALIVRGVFGDGTGYTVNIGTGFSAEQRQEIWNNRLPVTDKNGYTTPSKYLGEFAKFKYQEIGTKEAPRTPVFLGWRMKEDM